MRTPGGMTFFVILLLIPVTIYFIGLLHETGKENERIAHLDYANSLCSDLCGIWDMMFYEATKVSTSKDWFFCYCTTDDLTQKSFRVNLEGNS